MKGIQENLNHKKEEIPTALGELVFSGAADTWQQANQKAKEQTRSLQKRKQQSRTQEKINPPTHKKRLKTTRTT